MQVLFDANSQVRKGLVRLLSILLCEKRYLDLSVKYRDMPPARQPAFVVASHGLCRPQLVIS